MTEHQHPITPPEELVVEWIEEYWDIVDKSMDVEDYIDTQTTRYRKIADAELDACCEWVGDGRRENLSQVIALRNHRRPKPPSLAEDASKALDRLPGPGADSSYLRNWADKEAYGLRCAVRRVLERLQELEQGNE